MIVNIDIIAGASGAGVAAMVAAGVARVAVEAGAAEVSVHILPPDLELDEPEDDP